VADPDDVAGLTFFAPILGDLMQGNLEYSI
jgi:hypothetical protein